MMISSSQVLLEVVDVQVVRLACAECGTNVVLAPPPPPGSFPIPSNISLNWDNTYSFVISIQDDSIIQQLRCRLGLVTFLESGRRALTLVWICGVLVKERGVTSGKAM